MKAYVINLPRSVDRRASMLEQLERAGVEHEFIEAVDGAALTPEERAELLDEEVVERMSWWLTPGTIGCALSHLRVYQRVLETGAPNGLVLEDDALLPADLGTIADEVGHHMRGAEIALLYFRGFGVMRFSTDDRVELTSGGRLLYPMNLEGIVASGAYVITREACERMAQAIVPVRASPDSWSHYHGLGAIEAVRCVVPRPVGFRKQFRTTIERSAPLRQRVTGVVARRRIFPLFQLLALNRHVIEWRMSRVAMVDERSPMAVARDG